MEPQLAIVLCTLGRPRSILRLLKQVAAQLPAQTEICVVDQSNEAESTILVRGIAVLEDPRVEYIHQAPGLAAARNTGIARTQAPLVLFLDDDVELLPGCLEGHVAAFRDPRIGGVVGRIEEQRLQPNVAFRTNRVGLGGRVQVNLQTRESGAIETLKGCNMSFRRQALQQAGPFDPGFAGTAFLEDADMSTRVRAAGWQLWFSAHAAVVHHSAPNGGVRPGSRMAQEWWRFHNTGRFVRRHRSALTWPWVGATFAGVAAKRAAEWRSVRAAPRLLGALVKGWHSGQHLSRDATVYSRRELP